MDRNIKNVLAGVLVLTLLVVSYSAFVYSRAYSNSVGPAGYRSFGVNGEGKAVAVPDVAKFNFSVITQGGEDLDSLQEQNSEKINQAIKVLEEANIEDEDIKTSGYNVNPRYQNVACNFQQTCPPPRIVGYEISQNVEVTVRDFSVIGEVLSNLVSVGVNSVSNLRFTVDELDDIKQQARSEAIQKAKLQAEKVAEAGGFRLGKLLSVEDISDYYPYNPGFGGGAMEADVRLSSQATPVINPGSQEIVVRVNLRYEIR